MRRQRTARLHSTRLSLAQLDTLRSSDAACADIILTAGTERFRVFPQADLLGTVLSVCCTSRDH